MTMKRRTHTSTQLPQRTTTIDVNASSENGKQIWRAAAASHDDSTVEHVVSRYFVTEVLKKPIYPIDKERQRPYRTTKDVSGYTELHWCMDNSRHVQSTEFFVSSDYKPTYDVVFGKFGASPTHKS